MKNIIVVLADESPQDAPASARSCVVQISQPLLSTYVEDLSSEAILPIRLSSSDRVAKPGASRERVEVVPLVRRTDRHLSSSHQAFSVSSVGVSFLVRGRCMAEMSRAETKPITAQSAAHSQVVLNASITGACASAPAVP